MQDHQTRNNGQAGVVSRRVITHILMSSSMLMVFGGAPSISFAAPESFSLREPIFADYGNGKRDLLGELVICVQVSFKPKQKISLSISMPDSGQLLSIAAPFEKAANGDLSFQFQDDGWGNSGRGTFRRVDGKDQLFIEQVGDSPGGDKNIRRNYGTYMLAKRRCN